MNSSFTVGVATQLGGTHQVQEEQPQLAEALDLAVGKDRRAPWINPDRELVLNQA